MHLCNYAVQCVLDDERISPSLNNSNTTSSMISQKDFDEYLMKHKGVTFEDAILPKIRDASVRCIRSVEDRLERVGKGFEWLGLDFIVTESLEVLLLEVNVSPDISKSTEVTARLVEYAATDLFALLLNDQEDGDHKRVKTDSPSWCLWERQARKEGKSHLVEFEREKTRVCKVALSSNVNYGPRKLCVAERVMSALEIDISTSSSDLLSLKAVEHNLALGELEAVLPGLLSPSSTELLVEDDDDPDEL